MNTRAFLNCAICAGLSAAFALPAAAQEADTPKFRFGAGASVLKPMGSLTDSAGDIGFGASLVGEFALSDNMAIRGRGEYVAFAPKKFIIIEWTTSGIVGMADFVYRFDSHNTGLYVFGGAGVINSKYAIEVKLGGYKWSKTTTYTGLGVSCGGGYNFTKDIGVEASYTQSIGDPESISNPSAETYNPAALSFAQVSLRLRF